VFVAFGIQHALRVRSIYYFVRGPVWLDYIFKHYLINSTTLGEKNIAYKMCVWISSTIFFEIFLILRHIQRDITTNANWSSCRVPVILVRF